MRKNRMNRTAAEDLQEGREFIAWRQEYEQTAKYRSFGLSVKERLIGEAVAATQKGDECAFKRAYNALTRLEAMTSVAA